jgi:hypothetical protein
MSDKNAQAAQLLEEFEKLYGATDEVAPVKINKETGWCPSCQRVHTLEEWETIMSGQESGEWEFA